MADERTSACITDTFLSCDEKEKALRARIAELEEIVAELPLTADGVRVKPNMVVYQPSGRDRTVELGYRCDKCEGSFPVRFRNFHWPNYYSTLEAAEAAKGAKE